MGVLDKEDRMETRKRNNSKGFKVLGKERIGCKKMEARI